LKGSGIEENNSALTDELLSMLQESAADYTLFFRNLGQAARGNTGPARRMVLDLSRFDRWLGRWRAEFPDADVMDRVNPAYIPRNHLVEEALAAATDGNVGPVIGLLEAVTLPYQQRPGLERYAEPAPESFGPYQTFCGT
jgi:uncharacterized protein YdiU (UPF0061 family)